MKRIIALVLTLIMAVPCVAFADSISFPDLASNHWAHSAVMTLVGNGTIRGFEDGTFRPDATVSRAEFVKMIGMGPTRRDYDYTDVDSSHWGYDYIMTSGMTADGSGNFYPDTAITRNDVAELIWKRNGAVTGCVIPAIITDQAKNPDAAAWVYAYGIMIGDDGVNLRLNDTLTRAEAASLIVRATSVKNQINFVDTVNEDLLKTVISSTNLFDDRAYSANATITNGEMALAALRIFSEEHIVTYRNLYTAQKFDSKYARAVYNIGKSVLGEDVISADFSNKKANVKDTLAVITYYLASKARNGVKLAGADGYYPEIKEPLPDVVNQALTFAYKNGIALYADGKINASNNITMKEFAAILLQLDYIVGFEPTAVIKTEITKTDTSMLTDLTKYPSNASDYQLILKGIPVEVYQKAFNNAAGLPKDRYDFLREYQLVLTDMLRGYCSIVKTNNGADIKLTYYPSLACRDDSRGYTMRLKVDILSAPAGATVGTVFNTTENADVSQPITKGMSFFADFSTGQVIDNINPDPSKVLFDQVVYIN